MSMWSNAIELMLLGMGTVFVFLSLLVVGMILMSKIVNTIAGKETLQPTTSNPALNEAEIAAVAAAAYTFSNQK